MSIGIPNGSNVKGTTIAAIAFFIITIILIWQISSIYLELDVMQNKIKNQEIAVKNSENTLQRTREFVSYASKNKEIIEKFNVVLPNGEDKANLLSTLESTASNNGMSIIRINFDEINKSGGGQQGEAEGVLKNQDIDSRSIKLSLRGGYSSFKNFLIAIEKNLRLMDVVSISVLEDTSSDEKKDSIKIYSYSIGIKTYLYNSSKEKNITMMLSDERFKNFTIENLNFTKEKIFSDLSLPPDYNVNIGEGEIGNQNIF